jgi:hypothetical protein
MTIKYKFIFAFMGLVGFFACNNAPQTTNSTVAATETAIVPKWFFKSQMDTLENPQTQIFIILKDTVKITDATASFRELGKEEYADKKIPKEAIIACYGFWAGLEQQFILIDSSNNWVVKRKMIDSESPEGHEEQFEKMIEVKNK